MTSAKFPLPLGLLAAGLIALVSPAASAEEKPATLKDAFKDNFKVGTAISRGITSGRGFRRTWLAPAKDSAALVTCIQANDAACNYAVLALIADHFKESRA